MTVLSIADDKGDVSMAVVVVVVVALVVADVVVVVIVDVAAAEEYRSGRFCANEEAEEAEE